MKSSIIAAILIVSVLLIWNLSIDAPMVEEVRRPITRNGHALHFKDLGAPAATMAVLLVFVALCAKIK